MPAPNFRPWPKSSCKRRAKVFWFFSSQKNCFLLKALLAAPTRAELAWVLGRLDPLHPGTGAVLRIYRDLLERIDPAKVLVPRDSDWLEAGEVAGRAARALAVGGGRIATAFDRVELISDALTAIVARRGGFVA